MLSRAASPSFSPRAAWAISRLTTQRSRVCKRPPKGSGIEFDYAGTVSRRRVRRSAHPSAQRRNYDLIISIGFDQADAVSAVASRFPAQRFAIIDTVAEGDNVASYVYKEQERGFLLGAVAGLMTQRYDDPKIQPGDVVGVVGGMDIPLINANIAGFIAGARDVNPDADVRYSVRRRLG